MRYSTYNCNQYNATVTKDNNHLDVKVGNAQNDKKVPGTVFEYGVKSVNGKHGDVVLNADDIGAVSYVDSQDLTDEQKLIAQQNIGVDIHSVTDYRNLHDKPQINGVELIGNKTSEELGLLDATALDEYSKTVDIANNIYGPGLTVNNSKLNVKLGNGLEFDSDDAIQIEDEVIFSCGTSTSVISIWNGGV